MFGIDDVIGAGLKIIDKFIPDPEMKLKAQQELQRMSHDEFTQLVGFDQAVATGQLEINKEEAKSSSLFVAGWRPFIGWVCGSAFALHFLVFPILNFIIVAFGGQEVKLSFDMQTLLSVLLGMLGLGGLRTWEKFRGVAKG